VSALLATNLQDSIEKHTLEVLNSYRPQPVSAAKAIHDTLWGTSTYSPGEIAIIDTPLMQRLRGIHQTALAFLTYPSSTHTRFEHSLGVATIATKIVHAINMKMEDFHVSKKELGEIRLSALVHDCGHGVLSHISEHNFRKHHLIKEIISNDSKFVGCKPHEIISYLIISSKAFHEFFNRHIRSSYAEMEKVNISNVAGYIIGHAEKSKKYLANIINSAFDADKLDYIARDGYFSGLRLDVDIERFLYTLIVLKRDDGTNCLAVRSGGVQALEQILFSKMNLYSSLYHHHKVRAADSMLTSYVDYVRSNYGTLPEGTPKLLEPVDFLKFTDWDILCNLGKDPSFLGSIVGRIRNRELFKRALVITPKTLKKGAIYKFVRLKDRDVELRGIRQKIYEMIPPDKRQGFVEHDIVIDIPDDPSLRESQQCEVIGIDGDVQTLNKYFPTDDWLTSYYANKWRAHIFCPAEIRKEVNESARIYFYDNFGFIFEKNATTFSHLTHEDKTIKRNGKQITI
jgi:uncharacterized protein